MTNEEILKEEFEEKELINQCSLNKSYKSKQSEPLTTKVKVSYIKKNLCRISVTLNTPKSHLSETEILSKHGKLESLEKYFEKLLKQGFEDYLAKAKKAISSIKV